MQLHYVFDKLGRTTAVLLPIEEWNEIKRKYPEVEEIKGQLPQWQKDALDEEIEAIERNPDYLLRWDEGKDEFRKHY